MRFGTFTAIAAAAMLTAGSALAADDWPSRSITFVVPHAAGSTADVGARIIADELQERLGQPIVVENRAGAGGSVGTHAALQNDADGYTLILIAISNPINHVLRDDLEFDILTDVTPVTLGWTAPNVGVIHPDVPAETLQEYIELVKSRPGEMDYASSGIGTSQHFAGELLNMMAGLDLEHIPYSVGAQSVSDALGGEEMLVFNSAPMLKEHVDSGALRALGVTSRERSPVLPDVPTFEEAGLDGYDITAWWGLAVKAGSDKAIVDRLAEETRAVLEMEAVVERFASLGANASPNTPEEFQAMLEAEVEKYETLVEVAGIVVE
jgi:tripartite-type tricarboxylate transporter receptor subunit TctC